MPRDRQPWPLTMTCLTGQPLDAPARLSLVCVLEGASVVLSDSTVRVCDAVASAVECSSKGQ